MMAGVASPTPAAEANKTAISLAAQIRVPLLLLLLLLINNAPACARAWEKVPPSRARDARLPCGRQAPSPISARARASR